MANTIQKESKIIYLQIGQNYENLGVQKQFDVSEWTAEFPDAHIYLLFKRPGEEAAAPVNTTLDEDGILTWTVSNWETGIIGIGFAEIRAIDSTTGLVKKSHVIPCSIEASVTDEDAAPDYPSWVDRMLQFGENVDSIYATLPHELEEGIASIQQEAQTQTEAIEQKGITTRASIPEDYTTLSDDVTELKSAVNPLVEKTHGIERTGWNYYNDKIEDHPNNYWAGATVGSAISTAANNTYRAVLIPVESAIYTTSYAPRYVHYLDADKLLLRVDTNPTTTIDNTSMNATYLALTLYMSATDFILQKNGEKGYEEYTGHGAWVFDDLEQELPAIDDILEKTHGIERTGWNYYDDKIEDHPNNYWAGATVGSAVSPVPYDPYRAVLIPVESAIYTTSYIPRYVHYLDADKLLLRVDTNPTTTIDNTSMNATYLALTLYMSGTNFVLKKDGEKGYEEYTGHGAWVFDNLEQDTVLHHYLPSEICCAVGRTIELYNNLVCLEADKYHVQWTCDVGTTFERKFSVTGAASNVGNHNLVMNLYDDSLSLVASYETILKIVNPSINTQLKGIPIGDSLTNFKAWIPEVQNLSDSKIKFIGTRGYSSDAAYTHEGRSGATSAWYVGNNSYTFDDHYIGNPDVQGSANPFWDGTKFSLVHYNTMQSAYIGGTPDFIVILLGLNGLSSDNTTNVSNIKTMVDNIQLEYPSLPVFVCNTPYRSNQNGYYSIGSDGYRSVADFQFSSDTKIMDLQTKIADTFSGYSNVYVVPMSLCMDREYDYGNIPTPVNPRLTDVTIDIPSESVHPQLPGYNQMADALWSSIAAHLMN